MGKKVLESGALVLSDKGVCSIDEFDKMSDKHEACYMRRTKAPWFQASRLALKVNFGALEEVKMLASIIICFLNVELYRHQALHVIYGRHHYVLAVQNKNATDENDGLSVHTQAMELVRLGDASVEAYKKLTGGFRDLMLTMAPYNEARDGLGLEDRPAETSVGGGKNSAEKSLMASASTGVLAGLKAPTNNRGQGGQPAAGTGLHMKGI